MVGQWWVLVLFRDGRWDPGTPSDPFELNRLNQKCNQTAWRAAESYKSSDPFVFPLCQQMTNSFWSEPSSMIKHAGLYTQFKSTVTATMSNNHDKRKSGPAS